jgi:NADH:ubiquinone oxidoreductase subunit K
VNIILSSLFALGVYSVLTQRSLVGVLVGIQLFFSALILSLVLLVGAAEGGPVSERARSMALMLMIFSHLQALVGLGLAVRLHYLRSRSSMTELGTMKH